MEQQLKASDTATIFLTVPVQLQRMGIVTLPGVISAVRKWGPRVEVFTMPNFGISNARDEAAKAALDSGMTHWFSLDDDIVWAPEQAEMLIDMLAEHPEAGIATGIYARKTKYNSPLVFPEPDVKPEAPWKIDCAGAGFQIVTRQTLVRMFEHYGKRTYVLPNEVHTSPLHQQDFFDGAYQSEDYAFQYRAAAIGIELWAHPDCIVGHWDGYDTHWPKWGSKNTQTDQKLYASLWEEDAGGSGKLRQSSYPGYSPVEVERSRENFETDGQSAINLRPIVFPACRENTVIHPTHVGYGFREDGLPFMLAELSDKIVIRPTPVVPERAARASLSLPAVLEMATEASRA